MRHSLRFPLCLALMSALLLGCSTTPAPDLTKPPLTMPTITEPSVVTHMSGTLPGWNRGAGTIGFADKGVRFTTTVNADGSFDFLLPADDSAMANVTYFLPFDGCTQSPTISDEHTRLYRLMFPVVWVNGTEVGYAFRNVGFDHTHVVQGDMYVMWIYADRAAEITGTLHCQGPATSEWNVHLAHGWNQVLSVQSSDSVSATDVPVTPALVYNSATTTATWWYRSK